jgi:hypothetical protein
MLRAALLIVLSILGLKPSVYFKPQEVWEIRGAEWVIS